MTWAPGELPEVDRQELQEPKTQRQVIYTRGRFFSFVRKRAEKKINNGQDTHKMLQNYL